MEKKTCFYNVYIDLMLITPLVNVENAPKFGETFFNYLLKDPTSFIKFISKNAEDIWVFANHFKNKRLYRFD